MGVQELLAGWQQTFDYDNLGNRKSTHEGGNTAGANRRQTVYAANALNQYTQISHPNAFDVLGRAPSDVNVTVNEQPVTCQGEFWRREVGDLPNALAAVWQPVQVDAVDPGAGPNGTDVPARRSGHRFVPMASETPFYDFDGNLVSDARWIYGWNGENQLIEMTTAAPALAAGVPRERYRFVYDSRSRRIARTMESWDLDAGAWVVERSERFVHDDWNVVAVVDAAGTVVQRYVWGNDLSGTPQGAGGVGGLLAARDAASGRSWAYAYDGNGNVSAVVDLADVANVGRYDYDAFGRTIATWGDEGLAGVNPYRFSTKPLEGTGLYYYGFRWYDAGTGRWVSRDPIGERGGVNLFEFVENAPTLGIDPLGQNARFSMTSIATVENGTQFYEINISIDLTVHFGCMSGHLSRLDIQNQRRLISQAETIWDFTSTKYIVSSIRKPSRLAQFFGATPTPQYVPLARYIVNTAISATYHDNGDAAPPDASLIRYDHLIERSGARQTSSGRDSRTAEMRLGTDWNSTRLFEHEIGHMLGASDFYLDPNTTRESRFETSPINSNWVNNLMADNGPELNWRNAEDLIRQWGRSSEIERPLNIEEPGRQPWPNHPNLPNGWHQNNTSVGSIQ